LKLSFKWTCEGESKKWRERSEGRSDERRFVATYLSGDHLHASREGQGIPEVSLGAIVVDGAKVHSELSHRDVGCGEPSSVGHDNVQCGQVAITVKVVLFTCTEQCKTKRVSIYVDSGSCVGSLG